MNPPPGRLRWLHRERPNPERGQVGGIEALPFGVLVFVVAALLVASTWAVVDAKLAVVAAAREAARSYVESDSATDGTIAAQRAARDAVAGHGRGDEIGITIDHPPSFARCSVVTVRVTDEVPAVRLPWFDGIGAITVAARHSERIDPYRDGIAGPAACPP